MNEIEELSRIDVQSLPALRPMVLDDLHQKALRNLHLELGSGPVLYLLSPSYSVLNPEPTETVSDFIAKRPTLKILALSFLILIGVLLVAEGFEPWSGVRAVALAASPVATHAVDVTEFVGQKRRAMQAHASQIDEQSFFLAMGPEVFEATFGTEWYIRHGEPGGIRESDLFEGIG